MSLQAMTLPWTRTELTVQRRKRARGGEVRSLTGLCSGCPAFLPEEERRTWTFLAPVLEDFPSSDNPLHAMATAQ